MKLYASEIAAIVGLNKFKNAEEALKEALDRNSGKNVKPEEDQEIKQAVEKFRRDYLNIRRGGKSTYSKKNYKKNYKKKETPVSVDSLTDMLAEMGISELLDDVPEKAKKAVTLEYGIQQERYQLRGKNDRQKSFTREFHEGWNIVGKVDCIEDDGTIIEIKNRRHKLFSEIPDYEKVQLMAYLWLSGQESGILRQYYRGKHSDFVVNFDEVWFEKYVLGVLRSIASNV